MFFSSSKMFTRKKRGFSLGEVILSAFVLTAGITTVLSLIAKSYQNSRETQDTIIAAELAQEGVELLRNIRDNAIVDGYTGDNVFRSFPNGNNVHRCIIGPAFPIPAGATTFNCGNPGYQLYLNNTTKTYSYTAAGSTASKYFRAYRIVHRTNSGEARIQVFVAWKNPGANFNGNDLIPWCTVAHSCVYTELFLTAWK